MLRDREVIASPGPSFVFEANDVVVAVGTREGLDGVTAILAGEHERLSRTEVHSTTILLIEVGALLFALGMLGRLGRRVGLSPIPLYLLAGLAFGHGGLVPLSASEEFIEVGAEIGVILLLVMLGLEYSASELVGNLRASAPGRPARHAAQRAARRRLRVPARLGLGGRDRAGRHHLGVVVRGDRQGARRPGPAR